MFRDLSPTWLRRHRLQARPVDNICPCWQINVLPFKWNARMAFCELNADHHHAIYCTLHSSAHFRRLSNLSTKRSKLISKRRRQFGCRAPCREHSPDPRRQQYLRAQRPAGAIAIPIRIQRPRQNSNHQYRRCANAPPKSRTRHLVLHAFRQDRFRVDALSSIVRRLPTGKAW
jgi:hypothetical protein